MWKIVLFFLFRKLQDAINVLLQQKGGRLPQFINHCVDHHPRNELCVLKALRLGDIIVSFPERQEKTFPRYNTNMKYIISQGIDPIG